MKKTALAVLLLVGVSAPAIADAPEAQWWDCGHHSNKTKKDYFMQICSRNMREACAIATVRFTKKLYHGDGYAGVICEPMHTVCVPNND